MSRITEYCIVTGKNSEDLAGEINTRLANGWKLRGNLVIYHEHLLQAMVRRKQSGKRIRKTSEDQVSRS